MPNNRCRRSAPTSRLPQRRCAPLLARAIGANMLLQADVNRPWQRIEGDTPAERIRQQRLTRKTRRYGYHLPRLPTRQVHCIAMV